MNDNGVYDHPPDPSNWDDSDTDGDRIDDEDELCYQAENNWDMDSADDEDWGSPGSQY